MHTSLAQCAGLLAPCADRRAARACRQVAAPDKSCELGDRDGGEDAGERTACGPAPAPRRVTQVSPSVTLTACAMYAGRSHAQSRNVLHASRIGRRRQQQCDGEQQRARDDRRRRCGPAACDRVARAVDGCGRGLAPQVRGGGSRLLQPSPSGGSLRPVSSNLPQHVRQMGREGRCANARPSSRPPDSPAPWPLSQPARCTSDVRRSQPRATSRRAPREPERAAAAAAASRRTATCSRRSAAALRAGGARSRRQGRRGLVAHLLRES